MTDQTVIPPARRQHSMMVKNLTPRLPERGRVKIGELGEVRKSRSGNDWQMPIKLDHFKVTTLERGQDGNFVIDREFHDKHGDSPTEIPIRLIYDDIDLSAPTRYACYSGKTLWCSGDGETATRISGRYGDKASPEPLTVQCPCHRQDPGYQGNDKCKLNVSLSFLIEGMGGVGGVWKLRSTSWNTTTGLLSSMAFLRSVTGGILANIPLRLRLQPKQAMNPVDQSSVLIYVVSLEFPGDIAELQQIGHQIALDRATTHLSIANIEQEARRQLALPGPANAILPGDDPDDVVAEFYPEQVDGSQDGAAPPRPTREQFAAPQAPEHDPETGEIAQPATLSDAEVAELAEMVRLGNVAANGGTNEFTKFWNDAATKPYRPELSQYLDVWGAAAKAADNAEPFDVVDMAGVVTEYPSASAAIDAYQAAMDEGEQQKGESGLTLVWDNNQGLMNRFDASGVDTKPLSVEYGERRQAAAAREALAKALVEKLPASEQGDSPPVVDVAHADYAAKLIEQGLAEAEKGKAAVIAYWSSLSPRQRGMLGSRGKYTGEHYPAWIKTAAAFDDTLTKQTPQSQPATGDDAPRGTPAPSRRSWKPIPPRSLEMQDDLDRAGRAMQFAQPAAAQAAVVEAADTANHSIELPLRPDKGINFQLLRDMLMGAVQKAATEGEIGDILGANADHVRRLHDAFPNYVLAIMRAADEQRATFGMDRLDRG